MDVNAILKRFLHLNQARLMRARDALRPVQQDVIDVLPLLFHVNHPSLPGYISDQTPSGISNYRKEGQAIQAGRHLFKQFDYHRSIYSSYEIQSLFLIGSSGTIAQSNKSDFDVWLCHTPDLSKQQLSELREKSIEIEKWADGYNIEVHFFLMDAQRFKRGEVLDLSAESSGTAQHDLLLDEFYRTALWLAGNYPIWWLIPPDEEQNYDKYANNLFQKRFVEASEFIDFGGLGNMPASEFFGAAVWQIYKGVDSPYKSLLKILLMEIYASEYPRINFLSLMFKREIYEEYDDDFDLNEVDPYIMLANKLINYLRTQGDQQRLELVHRCLYFKIDMPLSRMRYHPGANWQQDLLMQMIRSWGWETEDLRTNDNRNTWKIDTISREKKILVSELNQSYFKLSEFARANKGLMISKQDLHILGRKLFAAFERKTGKLEILVKGFSSNLHEPLIGLSRQNSAGNRSSWFMFRGNGLHTDDSDNPPLKRASSALELISWGYFNKLINRCTSFAIKGEENALTDREISSIIDTLEQHFPEGDLPRADISDFSAKSKLLKVLLFVNVGVGNPIKIGRLGHLITDRDDAFSYSNLGENLVQSVSAIFITSWEEALLFHYKGDQGLLDCVTQYLQWSPLEEHISPPAPEVYCFSSSYHQKITQRMQRLFQVARELFYDPKNEQQHLRYLFPLRKGYAMLAEEDGVIRHHTFNGDSQLLKVLCQPRSHYSKLLFDAQLPQPLLRLIYDSAQPNRIQFYFYPKGRELEIFIIDERGSLFFHTLPLFEPKLILQHYQSFLSAVIKRQTAMLNHTMEELGSLFCYQVLEPKKGPLTLEHRQIHFSLPNAYYNVQVIGDSVEESEQITVYCNDREFSSFEYGQNVFKAVARHILSQRKSGANYPIYITDIDLPESVLGVEAGGTIQTLHYLNYKKRIEAQLNQVQHPHNDDKSHTD